MFTQTTTCGTY